MFEDIQQHRAAVAEQIQKACEIGFTGNELEKAHQVGDIHPNGKWVWTQLPSGRYDWRVIKKTGAPSGGSAPAAGQGKKEDHITISPNHPALGALKGVNAMKEYLTTFNSKYTDMSKVEVMRTPKGNWDVHYDGHRLGIFAGDQVPEGTAKKMGWLRTDSKDLTRSKRDSEEEAKKETGSVKPGMKPKVSAFVTKTMDEIKKTVGWRNYTEQKLSSIAKKIQENEELAKKVMSGKFPTASWSAWHPNEESVKIGSDELIFSAYKSVHSSRYAPHNGQTDYHYSVKVKRSGGSDAKEIARGSYSSGRYGGTAAEAKKECKIDALLRLIGE